MKKIALSLMLALTISTGAWAQSTTAEEAEPKTASSEQLLVYENPDIFVALGDIDYKPQTTGQKVQNALVGALTNQELSVEDETMVPMVKEALTDALTKPFRLILLQTDPSEEQMAHQCLRFTATITGCNVTNSLRDEKYPDKKISVNAFVYLTDMKTGEVICSRQVVGWSWSSLFTTTVAAERSAVNDMKWELIHQFNQWFPLRGHMLEKGLEKGKKQKLKEIYIDLGSDKALGTGWRVNVYTVRRIAGRIARKYIGYGKVQEVLGGDISSVKLSRGADVIKQCFDNGAEIAVSVQ